MDGISIRKAQYQTLMSDTTKENTNATIASKSSRTCQDWLYIAIVTDRCLTAFFSTISSLQSSCSGHEFQDKNHKILLFWNSLNRRCWRSCLVSQWSEKTYSHASSDRLFSGSSHSSHIRFAMKALENEPVFDAINVLNVRTAKQQFDSMVINIADHGLFHIMENRVTGSISALRSISSVPIRLFADFTTIDGLYIYSWIQKLMDKYKNYCNTHLISHNKD